MNLHIDGCQTLCVRISRRAHTSAARRAAPPGLTDAVGLGRRPWICISNNLSQWVRSCWCRGFIPSFWEAQLYILLESVSWPLEDTVHCYSNYEASHCLVNTCLRITDFTQWLVVKENMRTFLGWRKYYRRLISSVIRLLFPSNLIIRYLMYLKLSGTWL